jgi:hypothetical protein
MKISNWMLLGVFAFAAGCNESPVVQQSATTDGGERSQYLADVEPEGALPVGKARESVKDEQAVTLVGVIGGSSKPFVDGLAAFTIVDSKVPYCAADEGCPTPWDYCCTQDQVKGNIATIKIVDDAGKPVTADARKMLNVKELSTVVVQGTARRDDQGNLTVAASKIFVRPGK